MIQSPFLHRGRIEEESDPEHIFTDPQSQRCREFMSRYL